MQKAKTQSKAPISKDQMLCCYELLNLQYIPTDLGPRNKEYDQIKLYLQKSLNPDKAYQDRENSQSCGIFLSGNPANGKTTVIKHLMRNYDAVYINAAEYRTSFQAFKDLYYHICGYQPFSQNITQQKLFDGLQTAIEKRYRNMYEAKFKNEIAKNKSIIKQLSTEDIIQQLGTKFIIIVDEVDFIVLNARKSDHSQYLYKLLSLQNVVLIFASNSLNFMDDISREGSRLFTFQEIQFMEYETNEKMQILNIRLQELGGADALFEENAKKLLRLRSQLVDLRTFLAQAYRSIYAAFKNKKPMVTVSEINIVTSKPVRPLQFLSDLQLIIMKAVSLGAQNVYLYVLQELGDNYLEYDVQQQINQLVEINLVSHDQDQQSDIPDYQMLVSKKMLETELSERQKVQVK